MRQKSRGIEQKNKNKKRELHELGPNGLKDSRLP